MKTGSAFLFRSYLLIFIAWLIFSIPANAQYYFWHPQQALTDSSADCTNPCLVSFTGTDLNDHLMLFYERSDDTTSTSIWFSKMDGSGHELLLSAPGIHYRQPMYLNLLNYPPADTAFILFFESDETGSRSIYYMKFHVNGTYSTPTPLTMQAGDIRGFDVAQGWSPYVSWEHNGDVYTSAFDYTSSTFLPQQLLLSGFGTEPESDEYFCTLIRQYGDSSAVVYFERVYQSGNYVFNGPATLWNSGENSRLSGSNSFDWMSIAGKFTWQNRQTGGKWGIMQTTMTYAGPETRAVRSTAFNYHSPALFDFPIIVKFPEIIAFVTDSLGNDEIMTSSLVGMSDMENQSEYPGPDRNPRFFSSVESYVFQIQLLWESLRNGHWTIFRSHYDMVFGEEEFNVRSQLVASPNPFSSQVKITIPSGHGTGLLVIYSSTGEVILRETVGENSQVAGQFLWNATVPAGLYLVRYLNSGQEYHCKLIKMN